MCLKKIVKRLLGKAITYIFVYVKALAQKMQYEDYRKKYDINSNFIFNGNETLLYGDGVIQFGEDSYIGRFSTIQSSKGCKVVIGRKCKIGPFFSVWSQSTNVDCDYNFDKNITPKMGDIIINDAVWIGANVVISPGITIGENSIIGANSVVTKDVPPYSIVGGVPAKLIRYKNLPTFNRDEK